MFPSYRRGQNTYACFWSWMYNPTPVWSSSPRVSSQSAAWCVPEMMATIVETSQNDLVPAVVRFMSPLAWADAGPEVIVVRHFVSIVHATDGFLSWTWILVFLFGGKSFIFQNLGCPRQGWFSVFLSAYNLVCFRDVITSCRSWRFLVCQLFEYL